MENEAYKLKDFMENAAYVVSEAYNESVAGSGSCGPCGGGCYGPPRPSCGSTNCGKSSYETEEPTTEEESSMLVGKVKEVLE